LDSKTCDVDDDDGTTYLSKHRGKYNKAGYVCIHPKITTYELKNNDPSNNCFLDFEEVCTHKYGESMPLGTENLLENVQLDVVNHKYSGDHVTSETFPAGCVGGTLPKVTFTNCQTVTRDVYGEVKHCSLSTAGVGGFHWVDEFSPHVGVDIVYKGSNSATPSNATDPFVIVDVTFAKQESKTVPVGAYLSTGGSDAMETAVYILVGGVSLVVVVLIVLIVVSTRRKKNGRGEREYMMT